MIAVAAALALSAGCIGGLCDADTLHPFFTKLTHAGARPVHILQIGDSHTAGDAITGAWRDLLQQKYGSAGRGILPPGRPYDGYITHGVSVTMSPGWKISSDFGSTWSMPSPPLGLSAFTLTSQADGASMALVADPNEAFDRLVICGIVRPGAGKLALHAGTESADFDLSSATERPECRSMTLPEPVTNADISVTGGPVTLTSWATFRQHGGGVVLSNLGVVGSQLLHWSRTDDAVLSEELSNYRPDLIVIAFGTNEGFSPRVSDFEYEVTLRTQIGRIRRLAGNVPMLILGAPDALSRRAEMRANAAGDPSANCGGPQPAPAAAPPSVIGTIMERLRNSIGMAPSEPVPLIVVPPPPAPPLATGTAKGPLFPPAGLKVVRDIQRRVAHQLNVAFWDWEARMGGRCTADAWVHANPPLMRGDYVHYTTAGGREIAQRLEDDLDRAAAR